jgi:hypothetical protein
MFKLFSGSKTKRSARDVVFAEFRAFYDAADWADRTILGTDPNGFDVAQRDDFADADVVQTALLRKPVLPAQVLDYLVAHPIQIPDEWNDFGRVIVFWGSVFHTSANRTRFVRILSGQGGKWETFTDRLEPKAFDDSRFAALAGE